jgi:hypothetical protein
MKKNVSALVAPALTLLKSGDLPDPGSIPAVPEGEKPMDGSFRQGLLKIAAEQRAEVDQAMEQLWAKRAEIGADLGTLAPDAEQGKALHERMLAAREANRKVQALAAYTEQQEALANHAVIGHINAASSDIEHMAQKNPQIAARYERVLAVRDQRREAIVAGIARAKAGKGGEQKRA